MWATCAALIQAMAAFIAGHVSGMLQHVPEFHSIHFHHKLKCDSVSSCQNIFSRVSKMCVAREGLAFLSSLLRPFLLPHNMNHTSTLSSHCILRPEAGNSTRVFDMGNRDPTNRTTTCCFPGCSIAGSWNKQGCKWDPCPPVSSFSPYRESV